MSKGWHTAGNGGERAWRKIRDAVLAANRRPPPLGNNGMCTLAIEGVCSNTAVSAHHTLGRKVTGDDLRYLTAVCAECNHHVGDPMRTPDPPSRSVTRW